VTTEKVRLVLVPATVTDRKGRPVRGLEREDFRIYEEGRPQEIRYFSAESQDPVAIAFLLDVSGSMRQLDKLEHAKEAIGHFLSQLRPDDILALVCFADEQVSMVTEFTSDRDRFRERLAVQHGYGRTALHDAVAAAPGLVDEAIKGRKAIVLITDGVDNASRLSAAQAAEIAGRVSVPIYAIAFLSSSEASLVEGATTTDLDVLRIVSEATGGRLFVVHGPDELKEAAAFVDSELRFQYVLGYYPAGRRAHGEFRTIQLEVSRRRLHVRTRAGYVATP
jgi:VWFA-related protein